MSVTFDLVVWPWPFVKVKKADVIRCRLLYCTLVPGMMSIGIFIITLWDITICLFYVTFDIHLWPSAFVKVICILIIICILCCWMFVTKMKFVGSVEFENWQSYEENLNDVTMTTSSIRILQNSNTNLPRAYLSDKLNFILIGHDIAEIQRREVNRKIWRKNGYYVTVTLTFDPRSPISIGFEWLQ